MHPSSSLSSIEMHSKETMSLSGSCQSYLSHRIRPLTHTRKTSLAFTPFSSISEPRTYTTMFASAARKHFASGRSECTSDNLGYNLARAPGIFAASAVWMLYTYAFVSLVFSTTIAYSVLERTLGMHNRDVSSSEHITRVSYLDALSPALRLAKISSLHPPPMDFEPSFM